MTTSFYAALLALVFLTLSARVIRYRRAHKLGLGDHGDKSLLKRMRAQANFTEYAPLGLILMLLVELEIGTGIIVHLIGLVLLAGRIAHAYGFSASPPIMKLRVAGMMLTFGSILLSIVALIIAQLPVLD